MGLQAELAATDRAVSAVNDADDGSLAFERILSEWETENGKKEELLFGLDESGRTLLHRASILGRKQVMAAILNALPNDKREELLFIRDQFGDTALHWAYDRQIVELTFDNVSTDSKREDLMLILNTTEHPAVNEAALRGKAGVVEELLDSVSPQCRNQLILHHDSNGYGLLSRAARSGDEETIGHVINCCYDDGKLPSYVAKLGLSFATPFRHLASYTLNTSMADLLRCLPLSERRRVLLYTKESGSPSTLQIACRPLQQRRQVIYYNGTTTNNRSDNATDNYLTLRIMNLFTNEYEYTKPRLLLFFPQSHLTLLAISSPGDVVEVREETKLKLFFILSKHLCVTCETSQPISDVLF